MAIYSVEYRYTEDSAGRDAHRAEHRERLVAARSIRGDNPAVGPLAPQLADG